MSGLRFGAALGSALLAAVACATAEDVPDEAVRPAQFGGSSGTGGSAAAGGSSAGAGSGGTGTGGASASGGSGGSSGSSGGSDASGGSGGTGGSGASGGAAGSGGGSGSGGGASGGSGGGGASSAFFDDFESGSDGWIPLPSDGWSVVSDGSNVYQQGTLDTQFRVSSAGDSSWTDQTVEARVKVLAFQGSSSSYLVGVYARFEDLDNHYYVALDSYGAFKIRKKSGGNNTSITSQAPSTTIALNTWYTVKLEIIGSSLKAYLDGTPVLVATDTDIAAGGIALGTKNATAAFDDVRVTRP